MKHKIVDKDNNLITNITLKDFILFECNNWFYKNIHSRIIRAKEGLPQIKINTLNSPVGLSKREAEVFSFIGKGLTRQEIADILNISPKTVDEYKRRLKFKLNLRNDVDIANKLRDGYEKI